MAYVPIPKDLSAIKTKVIFGLTKRQLICFGIAAVIGLPLFFFLRKSAGNTGATFILVGVTLPAFLFALYQKNGMPLEKYVKILIKSMFLRPKKRPYKTVNYYYALEQQISFNEEVDAIVKNYGQKRQTQSRSAKAKAHAQGAETNRGGKGKASKKE